MQAHRSICFRTFMFLFILSGLGCEHAGPLEVITNPGDEAPSFAGIQTTIFDTSCALSGCHAGSNALLGLDLTPGQSYASLVNVRSREVPDLFLVNPGQPDSSYLIHKLEGGNRMSAGTLRMPIGRDPLSGEQIETVRAWIAAGAPDN